MFKNISCDGDKKYVQNDVSNVIINRVFLFSFSFWITLDLLERKDKNKRYTMPSFWRS